MYYCYRCRRACRANRSFKESKKVKRSLERYPTEDESDKGYLNFGPGERVLGLIALPNNQPRAACGPDNPVIILSDSDSEAVAEVSLKRKKPSETMVRESITTPDKKSVVRPILTIAKSEIMEQDLDFNPVLFRKKGRNGDVGGSY